MAGALRGIKVIEFAGIGPGPFCGMLLADMGAEIVRIDRVETVGNDPLEPRFNTMLRGRRNLALDLKHPDGRDAALRLCDHADILIEGYRPGVMEQLGLGPEIVTQRNPAIVYGRMTGWGQTGPLAKAPGHDINYIALSGALHAIGTAESGPVPPLVLAGDMGGGGTFLALGVLAAYIESRRSGLGQIVDAAIMEGSASLMTAFYGLCAAGSFVEQRESNRVDGGSHFYTIYETSDHEFISIGALEPKFYMILLEALGLDAADFPQNERETWPKNRAALAKIFAQKTQAEWVEILAPKNLCFAPVLKMREAPLHPQSAARGNFIELSGVTQPAPAPRFSRSQSGVQSAPAGAGEHTRQVLAEWGFELAEIDKLLQSGVAAQRQA